MLKINQSQEITRLEETTLQNENVLESYLRDLIADNPQIALAEIDEAGLVLLPAEIGAHHSVRDRIDLLGLDTDGAAVIIELKRGSHKLHLLQAISYAAMIASRPVEWFKRQLTQDQIEDLQKTIPEGLDRSINKKQRIVLIAEKFEPQLIIASMWIAKFGIGVKCIELTVTRDAAGPELRYMQFNQVFPSLYIDHLMAHSMEPLPAEFEKLFNDIKMYTSSRPDRNVVPAISRQTPKVTNAGPVDWEEFLHSLKNPDLVEFARRWEENGEKILPDSDYRLVFPRKGERWRVQLRGNYAWVMQSGRFEIDGEPDDIFWKQKLSDKAKFAVRREGKRLHLELNTKRDLDAFWLAISTEFKNMHFTIR